MPSAALLPNVVLANLACSEAEFRRQKGATTLCAKGVFVSTPTPAPVGSELFVRLRFSGGVAELAGEAVVVRQGGPDRPSGMWLRFSKLSSDGLPLETSPVSPVTPGAPAVAGTPRKVVRPPPFRGEDTGCLDPRRRNRLVTAANPGRTPAGAYETHAYVPPSEMLEAAGAPAHSSTGLEQFDLLGGYQLLKRVGEGGMAEVYLARAALAEGAEKLVALKTVRPQFGTDTLAGALFLNEAKINLTLQHPNIVPVFDFGEALGRPYLAMEHIHGRPVSVVLTHLDDHGGKPNLSLATAVCIEVCKALEYLHGKCDLTERPLELVHRDVSPSNIMIAATGEVKLLDFGIASASFDGATKNIVAGKYPYMSPEQRRGEKPNTSWDVYALGLVLNQMLTLTSTLPPSDANPNVPALLDRAVLDATQPEPSRRLSSARALRLVLEKAMTALPPIDLAQQMQAMFGNEFQAERAELQSLLEQARERVPAAEGKGRLARAWRAVRRKALLSPLTIRLARRPRLLKGALVALVVAAAAGGHFSWSAARAEASFVREVSLADDRVASGQLVGPGEDSGLDHLLLAKRLKPLDSRVVRRLDLLAVRFELLGDVAALRGDDAEAAAHFQASIMAEPTRITSLAKLRDAEERVKARSILPPRGSP